MQMHNPAALDRAPGVNTGLGAVVWLKKLGQRAVHHDDKLPADGCAGAKNRARPGRHPEKTPPHTPLAPGNTRYSNTTQYGPRF